MPGPRSYRLAFANNSARSSRRSAPLPELRGPFTSNLYDAAVCRMDAQARALSARWGRCSTDLNPFDRFPSAVIATDEKREGWVTSGFSFVDEAASCRRRAFRRSARYRTEPLSPHRSRAANSRAHWTGPRRHQGSHRREALLRSGPTWHAAQHDHNVSALLPALRDPLRPVGAGA